MVSFVTDEVVQAIDFGASAEELAKLMSLLCGQVISVADLSSHERGAIDAFLERVRSEGQQKVRLSYEELNELLLLFRQRRISRPFFRFFFLNEDPRQHDSSDSSIAFAGLGDGVMRFRGFAMLCFGDFRFAFRKLSDERRPQRLMKWFEPWIRDSASERQRLLSRQAPLARLVGTEDEIAGSDAWLLGYISAYRLNDDGKALERLLSKLADDERRSRTYDEPTLGRVARAKRDLVALRDRQEDSILKGKRNTTKYLTWDYLDVYLATSMRHAWEYAETNEFANRIFQYELSDLPTIRWFDPTQSYHECRLDKGLIESLMLKRAECTIYMAQEGDTLGKDSELASTLAQGKPVIAYVRKVDRSTLKQYADELSRRPLTYFRQRLLTLLSENLFDRHRKAVMDNAGFLGLSFRTSDLKAEAYDILRCFEEVDRCRQFQVIGDEDEVFRATNGDLLERAAKFLAAAESKSADARADTIMKSHPLGMQVHLETGVANGVLVARSVEQCAELIRGVLTRSLRFDIKHELDTHDRAVATVLVEQTTGSRFRAVTEDRCVANSFWNFYVAK